MGSEKPDAVIARLLLAATAAFSLAASASPLSSWAFRVLRTDHFEIVYRDNQKDLAKRYAVASEQAYELLIPIFKEAPSKTILVITDETDASNGLATFLPYPTIYVYPVLPTTLDSIDEFGDWPLEMVVHEYTHILNMYPAHGFYVPLKWIFGNVVCPNAVLPKWYLEGLAVNLESRLTDHGRLRSSETQAAARVLVNSHRLAEEDIPRINQPDISTWPYGSRPYLFGGWWWSQVQTEKGAGIIDTWNQNFSRRIPFFLNGPMAEQTQKTAEGLLGSTHESIEKTANEQLDILASEKTNLSTRLTPEEDGEQTVFAISPNGKRLMYWVSLGSGKGSRVYVRERVEITDAFTSVPAKKLFKTVGAQRARWIDDDRIVFDQTDPSSPRVSYRDLYKYDFTTDDVTRLTKGERAQEPSPRGDRIAFIQNDGGRNHLMLLDLKTGKSEGLVHSSYTQRLSSPEFLDDDTLLFVLRQRSGKEQVMSYSFKTKKTSAWNDKLASVQHLRVLPKGVFLSNADTGVRNAFIVTPTETMAVSNTFSDIQTVDYDAGRNEVLASELTPLGRRLMSFPLQTYKPPKISPVPLEKPPTPQTTKVKIKEEGYYPIAYMLPRYWIPFVYPVENGLLFQGTTSNADPVGRNRYSIAGAWDTVTRKPSYGLDYVNSSLPTDIGLAYGKSVYAVGAGPKIIESQFAGLNLINTWPFNTKYASWRLGGVYSDTESSSVKYKRMGPTTGVTYSRLDSPLNNRFGYHASVAHEEFIKNQNEWVGYGHTSFHLAEKMNVGKGGIVLHAKGAFAPKLPKGLPTYDLGDRTVGGNYLVNLTGSDYMLRGYPSGSFVGRKILNANLEYAFPLVDTIGGYGTFPVFLKDLELAFFVDTVAVDGYATEKETGRPWNVRMNRFFSGTGGELRLNSTTGYHLPISLILGGYYGFTGKYGGGFTPFFGIGLSGLGALE